MKVLDLEPERFSFGIYRNLLVAVWTAQVNGHAVERLAAVIRKVARDNPLGFSAIHLAVEGMPMPDGDARTGMRQLLAEHASTLACLGVVVGGDGFWGSALRAIVTSIWQGTARGFEFRICGSASEVVDWLPPRHQQRTGTMLDTVTLHGLLTVARTLPSSRPPAERRA